MLKTVPTGVFAVSFFGLFLGMSTTMVYSQIGMFMKTELQATETTIAAVEGIAEFISFLVRIFSGVLSDYFGERKFMLLLGCLVTLFARPALSIASSSFVVVIIQAIERVGNGFQATPRDTLIADLASSENRGRSYGLSRSLKTTGALLGTPIAVLIMWLSCDNYRTVFLCATVPIAIAVICVWRIKAPKINRGVENENAKFENPLRMKYLKTMDMVFWKIMLLAFMFELGHFCEALFPVYASQYLSKTFAGAESMCVSIGQVLMAFPIGLYADKWGKTRMIKICMILMIIANLSFIGIKSAYGVFLGAFFWGGQMTAVQGLFLSIISEHVDSHVRGTAIGTYYVIVGTAYLLASLIAGGIWTRYGGEYAFTYSLCVTSIAFCVAKFLLPRDPIAQKA
jgi:MFS family permease